MGRQDNRDRRSTEERREDVIAQAALYRDGLHNREDNWLTAYWYLWALGAVGGLALLTCASAGLWLLGRFFLPGR